MLKKYKLKKVFSCQEMDPDTRNSFNDFCNDSHMNYYNGSFISWFVLSNKTKEGSKDAIIDAYGETTGLRMFNIDNWLLDNGAEEYEEVLINWHW